MMNSIKPSYLSIGGLFVITNEFFLIVSITKEVKRYYDKKKNYDIYIFFVNIKSKKKE